MLFDAALALTRVFRHSNWERRFRSLATFLRQTFKYKFVGGFSHLVLVGYGYINNRHSQFQRWAFWRELDGVKQLIKNRQLELNLENGGLLFCLELSVLPGSVKMRLLEEASQL
ncbi:hypothetical protein Pint_06825 [Pistacia integerrima]|uniref:Uncharacterized protein n=1 Tax=Pistacia integerrima TaxID=434235 RepID=A0ACC0XVJ8_9ROSI|nr:hypothetical protein Pint_06825 [Pistacia integerrima]